VKGILRHGVKSITFKLAANFCISALNMPCLATIYPGKLTHTTSNTASKTSNVRRPNAGWEECGGNFSFPIIAIKLEGWTGCEAKPMAAELAKVIEG